LVVKRAGQPPSPEALRLVRAVLGVLTEELDAQTAQAVAAVLPSGLRLVVHSTMSIPTRRVSGEVLPALERPRRRTPREVGPGTSGVPDPACRVFHLAEQG
jgi:uncharacterized protein (DUF2267 family)